MIAVHALNADAIVIGAGPNGLALATYLAKAGLDTVVVEAADHVGGMAAMRQTPFPHHPHANFLNWLGAVPVAAELDLVFHGLLTIRPEVQAGLAFADGTSGLVLHRQDRIDASATSAAKHSRQDAERLAGLLRHTDSLTETIARSMQVLPDRASFSGIRDRLASVADNLEIGRLLGQRTAAEAIDLTFESPAMRSMFRLLAMEYGAGLHAIGGDLALFGPVLWMIGRRTLPKGGMSNFVSALERAALESGAHILCGREVVGITTVAGRAQGVALADGTPIRARSLIASSAPLAVTLGLIDAPPNNDMSEAVLDMARDRSPSIVSQSFLLGSVPSYRSAVGEPDLDRAAMVFVGADNPGAVDARSFDLGAGLLPEAGGTVTVNALNDPAQQVSRGVVADAGTQFPHLSSFTDEEFEELRRHYGRAFVKQWQRYVVRPETIAYLDHSFGPFLHSDRAISLDSTIRNHRTHLPGLYLCGTVTHPGGGVHGACGRNAYDRIAEDFGLKKPSQFSAS